MKIICPACNGTKIYNEMPCIVCGETGLHEVNEDVVRTMVRNGDTKFSRKE